MFVTLEEQQSETEDDDLLGTIVRTATALIKLDAAQESRMLTVTDGALTKGGELSIHAAADVLAYAEKDISQATVHLLQLRMFRAERWRKE